MQDFKAQQRRLNQFDRRYRNSHRLVGEYKLLAEYVAHVIKSYVFPLLEPFYNEELNKSDSEIPGNNTVLGVKLSRAFSQKDKDLAIRYIDEYKKDKENITVQMSKSMSKKQIELDNELNKLKNFLLTQDWKEFQEKTDSFKEKNMNKMKK